MVVPSPLFLIAVSSLVGAVWEAAPLGPELLTAGRGDILLQKLPNPREKQPELDPPPSPTS